MKLFLAFAFLALPGGPSWAAEPKGHLIFSIDQGFGNGIVANGNVEALNRMVTALEPLRAKHEVSVLLNPMIKDKQRLMLMLDTLVARNMPFVFDVYSSDSFTLGANGPANAPFDSSHGQSISVEQLAAFAQLHRSGQSPAAVASRRCHHHLQQQRTERSLDPPPQHLAHRRRVLPQRWCRRLRPLESKLAAQLHLHGHEARRNHCLGRECL